MLFKGNEIGHEREREREREEEEEDKMVICDIGPGSERKKYECKDSDHAFQHDFSFGKCLLHTCVDPHKCVIGFNIFLKIYKKGRQLDIPLNMIFL